MRRTIYIPIALLLIALSVVAIVRGQEWNAWSSFAGGRQPSSTDANSAPQGPQLPPRSPWAQAATQQQSARTHAGNEPNRIEPPAATPSRFASGSRANVANGPSAQGVPSRNGFRQQRSLPPLMIENKFATDPNYGKPPAEVVQAQASETTPSDEHPDVGDTHPDSKVQPAEHRAPSSRRQPSTPPSTTNVNDGADIREPSRLTESQEPLTSSNRSESIGDLPSSRRPHSLRESPPEMQQEPTPRVARREKRDQPPSLPAAEPQTLENELEETDNVLFRAAAPALAVDMSGPAKIGVGKTAEYHIAIANQSEVEAEDVVVTLNLPSWAEVTASEATLGAVRHESVIGDNSRIRWSIFRLAAGGSETLSLTLVARESRSFELAVNWTHAPKTHVAQIEVQEPKLEMSLSGPRDVLYGEKKTYTISVANPGTGPAENVVINLLPITPGQEKKGVSNLGDIEAGGRREIEIDLTARQAGDLELRAQAFADGGVRTETSQPIHVRRAALEVVVEGAKIKYAGTVAAYQVRVANTGDAPAEAVAVEAALPRNANFVSATDGGEMAEENGRVLWQIGSLRPGATRVFELRCVLAEAGSNRLEVIAGAADDLSSAAHWVTQVEALADLKLLINDPQGPVPAGEPTVYEVRIINRGTKAAESVQIASFFSEGIEPLSVEGGGAEIGIGQVVFNPVRRVAAGDELVYRITAKAETSGNHTFRTEVVCASPETKLAAQETTRFYGGVAGDQTEQPRGVEANLSTPRFEERR